MNKRKRTYKYVSFQNLELFSTVFLLLLLLLLLLFVLVTFLSSIVVLTQNGKFLSRSTIAFTGPHKTSKLRDKFLSLKKKKRFVTLGLTNVVAQ